MPEDDAVDLSNIFAFDVGPEPGGVSRAHVEVGDMDMPGVEGDGSGQTPEGDSSPAYAQAEALADVDLQEPYDPSSVLAVGTSALPSLLSERLDVLTSAIAAGLNERVAANSAAQTELASTIAASVPMAPQNAASVSLLGAVIARLKSEPLNGPKATLANLRLEGTALARTRDEITRVQSLLVSELTQYSKCTQQLNDISMHNSALESFKSQVAGFASQSKQDIGHVYSRINDPIDTCPDIEPLRRAASNLNADPDFAVYAKRVAEHATGAEIAAGLLRDKLNDPKLMSDTSFVAVELAARQVASEIEYTDFPVQGANVHSSNSTLKSSVDQIATAARNIAAAIIAALNKILAPKHDGADMQEPSFGV
jgi:hypothetical protein